MIMANEAREMVEKRVKEELERRAQKAHKICNTEIDEKIKARANEGFKSCEVEVELNLRSDIISIIRDNGYSASAFGFNKISIIW